MNRERIEETVRIWQAQPGKAKGKPTVTAWSEGSKAVIEHGAFSWHTDMPSAEPYRARVECPGWLRGCFYP